MTFQPYLADALCWDTTRAGLYESACYDADTDGNTWAYGPRQFQCSGYLPVRFYQYVYDGGETNQCVCRFQNLVNGDRVFAGHFGPCNGACVSPHFRCDGMRPIPLYSEDVDVELDDHASAGGAVDSTSTNLAVPRTISWKAVLCVVSVMMVRALV